MLYRVFSSPGNKENDFISKKIKEAFLDEKRVFVLVPEQGTALYERRVVSLCGNRASQRIEVTNFSRLSDVVLREYGSLSKKAPTDAEKSLILAECVHRLKPSLTTLNLKEDADFVKALKEDLSALQMAGLTPKAISDLEKQDLPLPELKEKLSHTALLSASFSAAVNSLFSDPMDEGERLANILKEYPFFRESVVFIDGFWDFTHPQKLVLEEILKQAENVFVTFRGNKKEPLLFSKPLLAARDLLQRANRNSLSVEDITLEMPEGEGALYHLAKHFGKSDSQMDCVPENMELWECKNQREEADYIAHRILNLVREGALFSEISILSRSGQGEEILALTLAEKNIPYFLEEALPLSRTPLAKTVLFACRFAFGKGSESDARFYIKNGFFPLEDSERFLLERYAATWSLTPKKLTGIHPFTMHPEGYFEFHEKDREELSLVNQIREKVFSPVRDLSLAMAEGTVEERICAILAFLNRIGAEKMLFDQVEKAKKEEDFESAAYLLSVWNSLLEALCAFGKTLGETRCDENRFLSLLDLALSENLPRKLPPAQDRVQIGRVNFSRAENTKYVFITGLCAGSFPQSPQKGGVLADREKEVLRKLGFPLAGGEDSIADEFFYFYNAALLGEKGLYLSYHREGSEAKSASLSVIGKRMLTLFPKLPYRVFNPEKASPLTEKDAFSRLVKEENTLWENSPLAQYFLKKETWKEKLLSAKAGKSFDGMRDTLLTEKPYENRDINMVYSRLEKYTLCPFSYFARYLLGAKEQQKATLGANIAGSFVHSVLEKVLLNLQQKGLRISDLTKEEIAEENRMGVESAIRDLLGDSLPDSMKFLLLRSE
ncbi:MAG: PD-(D/E)XK nuclease family protein, partial [Clostridia bacterium]|nr:PD-(D/E)XK nuclease family protein [Clostridia bacterium]